MKKLTGIVIVVVIIIIGSILFMKDDRSVQAGQENNRGLVFISVRIKQGDSLWSIASRYFTPEYKSVEHYISEIKKLNNITSNTLYEGHYLVVPFYYDIIPETESDAAKAGDGVFR